MTSLYPDRTKVDLIRWLAIGSIAGQLAWVVIVVASFLLGNEPGGDYGLVQRFALAAGGFWILVLTVGLLVVRRDRGPTSAGVRGSVSAAHPGLADAGSPGDG